MVICFVYVNMPTVLLMFFNELVSFSISFFLFTLAYSRGLGPLR